MLMKTKSLRTLGLALMVTLTPLLSTGLFAQADKVKERAKDLKKKVEGTQPVKTNAPAMRTNAPPRSPKAPK